MIQPELKAYRRCSDRHVFGTMSRKRTHKIDKF